jgi:hypothetical protein
MRYGTGSRSSCSSSGTTSRGARAPRARAEPLAVLNEAGTDDLAAARPAGSHHIPREANPAHLGVLFLDEPPSYGAQTRPGPSRCGRLIALPPETARVLPGDAAPDRAVGPRKLTPQHMRRHGLTLQDAYREFAELGFNRGARLLIQPSPESLLNTGEVFGLVVAGAG